MRTVAIAGDKHCTERIKGQSSAPLIAVRQARTRPVAPEHPASAGDHRHLYAIIICNTQFVSSDPRTQTEGEEGAQGDGDDCVYLALPGRRPELVYG